MASANSSSSSGSRDDILRHSVASKVRTLYQQMPLERAVRQAITDKALKHPSACAILALDRYGQCSVQSSGRTFLHASSTSSGSTAACEATTISLYPQHVFYKDQLLSAGFTRYPIINGHVVLECHAKSEIMSLNLQRFIEFMSTARYISKHMHGRIGLACDGGSNVSLIPLVGTLGDWKPVIHQEEEFHTSFPGFLTTKNGPKLSDSELTAIQTKVLGSTMVKEPYDYSFSGDASDQNLFARLIRGELSQWRVWEDKKHVAFLTPFANTPGYTVLVPRKHLSSDVFDLNDDDYTDMVAAAYQVAQHLKGAFGTTRCGIFFEGFEIDYAHIKLVPVHDHDAANGRRFTPVARPIAFQDKYEGFLTTQFGPLRAGCENPAENVNGGTLAQRTNLLHELLDPSTRLTAPRSWSRPESHSVEAANSPWYTAMSRIQSSFYHASIDFFHRCLDYQYALVPQTTDSISSPMGLGSDSEPVHIQLHGQDTFLADSMQFALEYALRLDERLAGAYYVGCSFRGEDHDQTHLNQFYHIECELRGSMDAGIEVAEHYITTVSSGLLEKHGDLIAKTAGNTEHVVQLLNFYQSNGQKFPRVSLDEALGLAEVQSTPGSWEYAVASQEGKVDVTKGRKLTRIGERVLIKIFKGAVWLTEMDHLSVPFYQAFLPGSEGSKALCANLLLGPGEVLGLGERHFDVQAVQDALKMRDILQGNYGWYLDIRDEAKGGKGMLTTGWGMGMERFLCWLVGHDDVRDMAIIPRLKGMKFQP